MDDLGEVRALYRGSHRLSKQTRRRLYPSSWEVPTEEEKLAKTKRHKLKSGRDVPIQLDGPVGRRVKDYSAAKELLAHAKSMGHSGSRGNSGWAVFNDQLIVHAEELMEGARGNFQVIQEPYQLVVASLFCQIVDLKQEWEQPEASLPEGADRDRAIKVKDKSYVTIYNDVLAWVGYSFEDPSAEWEHISRNHHLKFLLNMYERRVFWFEVVEVYRRIILSGALVLLRPGSTLQAVSAVFICLVAINVYGFYSPLREVDQPRPSPPSPLPENVTRERTYDSWGLSHSQPIATIPEK